MQQKFIEEFICFCPEEFKKVFKAIQMCIYVCGALVLLGIKPHWFQLYVVISGFILLVWGKIVIKNMVKYQTIHFLYCGIVLFILSTFFCLDIIVGFQRMYNLDPLKLLITYGIGYLFILVVGIIYYMWALRRGHFTGTYKDKHTKRNAFFTGLAACVPGGMLIVNVMIKSIFGANLFYKGTAIVSSVSPFVFLYVSILYFYKYYLMKKYQVNVEPDCPDKKVDS
jgi:hypothetical protein